MGVATPAAAAATAVGTAVATTGAVPDGCCCCGCCAWWMPKGRRAGVDVPDVLGVGRMLEDAEVSGGGSGEGANTEGPDGESGEVTWGWAPFMLLPAAAAATTADTPPLPLPAAALPLPLLTVTWLLALVLALLALALLLLDEDLKEERRFWAEDLRRIEGRRVGGCESEFGGVM